MPSASAGSSGSGSKSKKSSSSGSSFKKSSSSGGQGSSSSKSKKGSGKRKLTPEEARIYDFIKKNGVATQVQIDSSFPEIELSDRIGAINGLAKLALIRLQTSGGELQYEAASKQEASVMTELEGNDMLVYTHIRDAGNEGIWTKTIKLRANLHQTVVNRCLKSLEQKHLIKTVKNVKFPTRKIVMLSHLEPSSELSGGPWYSDTELDEAFIEAISNVCLRFIQQRTWPDSGRKRLLYPASHVFNLPTVQQILDHAHSTKAFGVTLSVENMNQLLDTLIYDEKIEKVPILPGQRPSLGSSSRRQGGSSSGGGGGGSDDDDDDDGSASDSSSASDSRRKKRKRRRHNGSSSSRRSSSSMTDDDDSASDSSSASDSRRKKRKRRRHNGSSSSRRSSSSVTDDDGSASDSSSASDSRRKKRKRRRHNDSSSSRRSSSSSSRRKRKRRRVSSSEDSSFSEESDSEGSGSDASRGTPASDDEDADPSYGGTGPTDAFPFVFRALRPIHVYSPFQTDLGQGPSSGEYGTGTSDSSWMQLPCGQCPVFRFCQPGGPVNAEGCEYYDQWIEAGLQGTKVEQNAEEDDGAGEEDGEVSMH